MLMALSMQAQLPFKTQFVQFVEGGSSMNCSIDPVTDKTYFSVSDPSNGNNEFVYEVSPEGKALTLSPELLGTTIGINRIQNMIVHDGEMFGCGLNIMPGSPPSLWSKVYTETDTLRYPDQEISFSTPYDMHRSDDQLFVCGQLDDTTYILGANHNGQLNWDTTIASNFSFSSLTSIGDTLYTFRHPTLFKFNAVTGAYINSTWAGGEGVGDCVSKDGAIYWACASGPDLYWAKHVPDSDDVWWDSSLMPSNFSVKAVAVDDFDRFWIAGNDGDGGHLIVFSPSGIPTDHLLGAFISDISIENGRVAICGGMGGNSPTDLKFLIVGILEE